jgi:hypothetical protein
VAHEHDFPRVSGSRRRFFSALRSADHSTFMR